MNLKSISVNDYSRPDIYNSQNSSQSQYSSLVQREQDLSNRMIQKYVLNPQVIKQKEIEHLVKHENKMRERRQEHQNKIDKILLNHHEIDRRQQEMKSRIKQMIHEREQVTIEQQRFNEQQAKKKLKQAQLMHQQEVFNQDAEMQEKEFQQKLHYIKQKLKQQEFQQKTDELLQNIQQNLARKKEQHEYETSQKNQYLDDFWIQKQNSHSQNMQRKNQHMMQVRYNYNQQMQYIQEFLQNKIDRYNLKIQNFVKPTKQQQIEDIHNRSQLKEHHINQVLMANNDIKQRQLRKYRQKISYLQQKVDYIQQCRQANQAEQSMLERQKELYRVQARAKSENYYRNKSINIVNKIQEKEHNFYNLMQMQRSSENEKLMQHNRQQQEKSKQVFMAEKAKHDYREQLSQRIQEKDLKVSQQLQIQNILRQQKSEIYNQRLKMIESIGNHKRNFLLQINNPVGDQTNDGRSVKSLGKPKMIPFFPTQIY